MLPEKGCVGAVVDVKRRTGCSQYTPWAYITAQERDEGGWRSEKLTISFSQLPSYGLDVEKYGERRLRSKSVGRCTLRRRERPPNPSDPSSLERTTPAAMASSRRRRNRRRRNIPRIMMAEEMARRRKRVARNVKLTHPPRAQAWSSVRGGAESVEQGT